MITEEREFQSMVDMELANLTVYSMCYSLSFARRICPSARIRSRCIFYYVSNVHKENEKSKRSLLNKMRSRKGQPAFVVVFAYPDGSQALDSDLLSLVSEDIAVIDATGVRLEQAAIEAYARNMVRSNILDARHAPDASDQKESAYEALGGWIGRVLSSPVTLYDREHPNGVLYPTLSGLYDRILDEMSSLYPCSPDMMALDEYFYATLGARYHVRDGYYGEGASTWKVADPEATPERLFDFVWGDDSAWYDPRYAGEKVVILKKAFDEYVKKRLESGDKVSFKEIFEHMRQPPYGMLPNVIGAILMGMFFRTWRNRDLIWDNGLQQAVLDDELLLAMAENGLQNQNAFYRNALVDYIMLPGQRTSALMNATIELFGLDRETTRFLTDLRSALRFAMEALPYPIVSARYSGMADADREVIDGIIRFVRITSDDADKAATDDLAASLNTAFQKDEGLTARLRDYLHEDALREGFFRMLEANGVDPEGVTEQTLWRMCGGRDAWKWVWREESIVDRLRVIRE